MAEIQESYMINTFVDNHDFGNSTLFPASNYVEKDSLVVTTSKNTVCLLKLTDSKPFKSWSAKQNQPFTCPVVYDKSTNLLCSVQKSKVLRQWSADSESIDSGKSLKLSVPVRQLISLDNGETLMVFENGASELVSQATYNSGEKRVIDVGEKILNTQAVVDDDVITILHHINSESIDTFYTVSLAIEDKSTKISKNCLKNKEYTLRDWNLVRFKKKPTLYTLWNNGDILKHQISSLETFTVIKTLSTNKNWICLRLIDDTHAIVVNSDAELEIQIWDLRYNVCKAKRNTSVANPSQFCLSNESLLVLSTNRIHSCGVRVLDSSLASSIGRNVSQNDLPVPKKISWVTSENENENAMEVDATELKPATISIICKEELSEIVEKKDVGAMMNLLSKYKDIPEPQIADMLNFILKTDDESFKDIPVQFLFKNDVYSNEKTSCVFSLMMQSYNDVFLYPQLKKISSKDTMDLLKFLHSWLKENLMVFKPLDEGLSISQGVMWMNLLLDSHYNDFLMMKDSGIQEFLLNMSETTNEYFEAYEVVDALTHLIQTIRNGKKVTQARPPDYYRVEVLIL